MLCAWQGSASSLVFGEETEASNPFNGMLGMQAGTAAHVGYELHWGYGHVTMHRSMAKCRANVLWCIGGVLLLCRGGRWR